MNASIRDLEPVEFGESHSSDLWRPKTLLPQSLPDPPEKDDHNDQTLDMEGEAQNLGRIGWRLSLTSRRQSARSSRS